MKNNKGFAVSGIIYSMIILFLLLMLLILMMLSSRKVILDKQKTDALNGINGTEEELSLYKEGMLNGAYPELHNGLVPITLEDDGTVKKADTTKMWYNYQSKRWANAVVLFGEDTYSSGDTIPESNIKQYYVWIPRYRYQLWNVNSEALYPNGSSESSINIVFENKKSAPSTGTTNGEWLTHPAFTNFNTNGIWVGKYEVSYDEETYTNSSTFLTSNPNYSSATSSSNIIIKPNVRSLTNKNVSELHTLIKESNTTLNSHMMTNMEWGAAAYLTYSNYGRCKDDSCTEVTMNNVNTGYYGSTARFNGQWELGTTITGCAADTVSATHISNVSECTNKYNTEKGYLASTTGNITGIYDMSGGSLEYVMGILTDANNNLYSGQSSSLNSGFKGLYGNSDGGENTTGIPFPNSKYYDTYISGDALWYDYTSGKLGDATKEIAQTKTDNTSGDKGLWFTDFAQFFIPSYPWIGRGGPWFDGSGTGMFYFYRNTGSYNKSISARAVLAP